MQKNIHIKNIKNNMGNLCFNTVYNNYNNDVENDDKHWNIFVNKL